MTQTDSPPARLRRNLSLWQVLAVSLGLMGPSMAANINPQGAVGTVGRAIPLTFVVATVGVLLVSYGFVRLSQHYHTSGSVYGFVGTTLGPRPGAASGWALIGTYILYGVTASITGGRFVVSLLDALGIWSRPPDGAAFGAAGLLILAALALAVIPIRRGTETILAFEVVTIALIVGVSAVVVARLVNGSGPAGHHFTLRVFEPQAGTGFSALALGVVFGFLGFAGFEASAALGAEAANPRRDIPRAILGTALVGGVFYVAVTAVEVMGYGTDPAGLRSFANSTSLFGHLGSAYAASWLGDVVTVGTTVSALGCTLACVVGASRLAYTLVRDGVEKDHPLAAVSPRWGTPVPATMTIAAAMLAIVGALELGAISSFNVFVYTATIGTLIILVVYVAVTIGAMRLLFFSGSTETPRREAVVPLLAIAVLGYTIYRNVWPYPSGALRWLPIVSAAWILLGAAVVTAAPRLARRFGARLVADDGLQPIRV